MSKIEKIKRITLVALGFGLATYLLMSGFAILNKEKTLNAESNATSEVHTNAVK